MKSKYLISVIIPVFRVEDYLDECLMSIISQTIGFDNIQVILVNDGSPDDSALICERFAADHPDNVIYIEQPNSGVAAARNKGLDLAEGELVTFLDGDDKWSEDSFGIAYDAYKKHPEVSVFSCRMIFFDGENGEHQLNYKYKEDRTIDIREDYNFPQLSSSSVFIRADAAKGHRFRDGLKYSEDFRFINEILLDDPNMMLLKDPVYWYRRRQSGDSAIQRSVTDPDYYTPTCRQVYRHLFDLSIERFGYVLRYLQFCVMYDLKWRLKIPLAETGLDDNSREEYCAVIVHLLQEIDDDIILEQKRIALALQLYALELKHGRSVYDKLHIDEQGVLEYEVNPLLDLPSHPAVRIDSVKLREGGFIIHGQLNPPLTDDRLKYTYSLNGIAHDIQAVPTDENIKTYWHGILKRDLSFTIDEQIDCSHVNELTFIVSYDGREFATKPRFSASSGLDNRREEVNDGDRVAYRRGTAICFEQRTLTGSLARHFAKLLSR